MTKNYYFRISADSDIFDTLGVSRLNLKGYFLARVVSAWLFNLVFTYTYVFIGIFYNNTIFDNKKCKYTCFYMTGLPSLKILFFF